MPGQNLTRLEAEQRSTLIAVDSYQVTIDVTAPGDTFVSTTTVNFTAQPGSSTFIDLIAESIDTITLNGRSLDPQSVFHDSRISLDDLTATNTLTVTAHCRYMNTGEGLHRFVDPVDNEVYLYTQFEVPDARRMFAVFEQPDLKATFQFTVTAPSRWEVVSNQPTPQPVAHDNDTATWQFPATPRISSYITALVAGPYTVTRSELTSSDGRTIPLGVFSRASMAEHLDTDEIIDITRRGFEFFESQFQVPYPFEKYDQLFVPEFNAGAMENAGCVTFTETYVFRSKVTDAIKERRVVTILHELAHMWFGDLVTMKWWNDLWLNESFAEWASTLATAEATQWHEAWTTFNAMEKTWAYRQDQLPSTHPIVAPINDLEDVYVNFDGITYAKGGSVLKQLVAWVGLEQFMAGVSAYFTTHAWGNTELGDLLRELEKTSGRELTSWASLWLETAGVNTLSPRVEVDEHGTITSFVIEQTATPDYPTLRPHRMAVGFYSVDDNDALVRTHRVELDVEGATTHVTELEGTHRPALILLNDDDLAYAKIRFDSESLTVAAQRLSDISAPLARSLVWAALWDATRDGEFPASDYVALVLNHIGRETESTTLRTTLAQVVTAARMYVAPARRKEAMHVVSSRLWDLARDAAPGSDAQFQFVKYLAALPVGDEQQQALRDLLEGTIALEGLTIDTDLRWELLEGLVLSGHADSRDIDAALEADSTASGAQAAARARAALPTPEGKRAAFDSLVVDTDATNAIARATAQGFVHVLDADVVEALVEPYFESLERLWSERSFHMASQIITGLFPTPLASQELSDAAHRWLSEHADAAPALRRVVVECLADVDRALAVQRADRI